MAGQTVTDAFRRIFAEFEQQERDKHDMYLEVGRAIVSLSVIEEFMAAAFVALSKPMAEDQAGAMFYECQNITHKLKLLDYAVMKSEWAAGKEKWPSLSAKIAKQIWMRNDAAHSSLGFRYEKNAKKWHIKLQRQEFDRKKKEKDLEIADVQASAIELQELCGVMRKFVVQTLAYADFKIE